MHRLLSCRPHRRHHWYAICAAWAVVALVAAMMTQQADHEAAASDRPSTVLSEAEAAAGLVALGEQYPGGFAGLIGEFETGGCADLESYDSASSGCQAILDQIAQLGAGQIAPERIPDLSGEMDWTIPPEEYPEPDDEITPEMVDWMEAEGAPADLIAALREDPPRIPDEYDTWVDGPSGFGTANQPDTGVMPTDTSTELPTEPTGPTETTVPTEPTEPTGPTGTTEPTGTTGPTETTVPTTEPTEPTETTTYTSTATSTTTAAPPPPPPPPPNPPLLVAVGDSVTSGHEARGRRTTCDDPLSSWANNLRAAIGVPANRYFNYAHSGASTADVIGAVPYRNPCGVVSQNARSQLADAAAILRANPSVRGWANVAVSTAGVNDTNWTTVARQLVGRQRGGRIAARFGATPNWAVANPGACTDWIFGNPAGNPGAPPGAIAPAWDGAATSGAVAIGNAGIALGLISADPGAQVRHLLYYRWRGDPNLPRTCAPAAVRATTMLNGWVSTGVVIAKIVWGFFGGDARRIQAVCQQMWVGRANIQTRLVSWGRNNWALVPGWPHPNAAGRGVLSNCVNGTLARFPGGGIA